MRDRNFSLRSFLFFIHSVCILPMRDRNSLRVRMQSRRLQRLYLTYEGSKLQSRKKRTKKRSWFVSYLWGIETFFLTAYGTCRAQFVSYLWGIETWKLVWQYGFRANGLYLTYEGSKLSHGSGDDKKGVNGLYLTYEGSKPMMKIQRTDWFVVCILPMRDRNSTNWISLFEILTFSLYLTYEGSKH